MYITGIVFTTIDIINTMGLAIMNSDSFALQHNLNTIYHLLLLHTSTQFDMKNYSCSIYRNQITFVIFLYLLYVYVCVCGYRDLIPVFIGILNLIWSASFYRIAQSMQYAARTILAWMNKRIKKGFLLLLVFSAMRRGGIRRQTRMWKRWAWHCADEFDIDDPRRHPQLGNLRQVCVICVYPHSIPEINDSKQHWVRKN